MAGTSLARRFHLVAAFLIASLLGIRTVSAQSLAGIEKAMRDIQVRNWYVQGYNPLNPTEHERDILWPPCCGDVGHGPGYPPDGYYSGSPMSIECAVTLVKAVADALNGITENFLNADEVDSIESRTEDPNNYDVSEDFPALHRAALTGGVTENNYDEVFALCLEIIPKLKYIHQQTLLVDAESRGGLFDDEAGDYCTCAAGEIIFEAGVEDIWDNGWSAGSGTVGAWDTEYFCPGEPTELCPGNTTFTGYNCWRVKARIEPLEPEEFRTDWQGEARVYLIVHPASLGVAHDPPVPSTETYQLFETVVDVTEGFPEDLWINANDDMPEPFYSCGGTPMPPECDCEVGEENVPSDCSHGWSLGFRYCVLELVFDHAADEDEPCEADLSVPHEQLAESDDHDDRQACEDDESQPEDPAPVMLSRGRKIERATDLVVALPGRDFVISREYSSQPDVYSADYGLVGANWALSVAQRINVVPAGETVELELDGPPISARIPFKETGASSGVWRSTGRLTQQVVEASVTIDEDTYDVWRLSEPGEWDTDFFQEQQGLPDPLVGHIAQHRDMYGNTATFVWTVCDADGGGETARISGIYFNGTPASETYVALASFIWYLDAGEPDAKRGRLHDIQLERFDAERNSVVTNTVQYTYYLDNEVPAGGVMAVIASDQYSDDLGTDGDLIQVRHRDRVDNGGLGLPYRTRITQYRYHNGDEVGQDQEENGVVLQGLVHQLKSVLLPEQIEFAARRMLEVADNPAYGPEAGLELGANTILTSGDASEPFSGTGFLTSELASKLVSYEETELTYDPGDESRVTEQYLQSSCGCGGSNVQGLHKGYSYLADGDWLSTKIVESTHVGTSLEDFRLMFYDMQRRGDWDIAYLINKVIQEPGGSPRQWVWHRHYDAEDRADRLMTPSAKEAYTPSEEDDPDPAQWEYSAFADAGLVHAYSFTDDDRIEEVRVGEGDLTSFGDFILVQRTNYPASPGADERIWLPTSIEQFRVEDSSAANDVEVTNFTYDFHSGDAIAWIKTEVEAELESENGPDGEDVVYSSYELVDNQGLNRWSRDADNSLTFRDFDPVTGVLTQVTRNADPDAPGGDEEKALDGADYAGLTVSGWGTPEDGGELTSTYAVDRLGRTIDRSSPGGVHAYIRRELRVEDQERPEIYYYVETSLPQKGTGEDFNGPADVTWFNASSGVIRASEYALDAGEPYFPSSGVYTLDTELSQSITAHHLAGLVQSRTVWHDIANNRSYTTAYKYDELGRLLSVTDANGTITQNAAYDVLGRVLQVKVGTDDDEITGNMQLVAEYFYDSGGDDSQGEGNGNLTLVRQHTGDDGTLAADERDTVREYDFRDRLTAVLKPQRPHEWIQYDNLGRVLARALYKDDPPWTGGSSDGDRAVYVASSYSQRGLLYRQEVAIDPTDLGDGFLATNHWFSPSGRGLATWGPNAPGTKRVFDGLGRTTAEYITDRGGDAAPGASDNYADATDLTDDHVVEQSEFLYDSTGDLLTSSRLFRLHDATATGALSTTGGTPSAVKMNTGYTYDEFDRPATTVVYGAGDATEDLGTMQVGGSTPTDHSSPDEWALVTSVGYGVRGLTEATIDPMGKSTKFFYDDLGRRIAIVENWDDAAVSWDTEADPDRWDVTGLDDEEPDTDRATTFEYDGLGNVVLQTAHNFPNGGSSDVIQDTRYTYGTTVGDPENEENSLLASEGLLSQVEYPDGGTVTYSYNRLGELRSVFDQNETRHAYHRDLLGRVTADAVIEFGDADIDEDVERLGALYDEAGRLSKATAYTDAAGTTVKNQVEMQYNPLWQVAKVYQDHDGTVGYDGSGVPTGNTKVVKYTYADEVPATGNFSRLATMVYPDSGEFGYTYGTSGGIPDRISRVELIAFNGGIIPQSIVKYSYVGLSMPAVVDYQSADVQLDRTFSQDGARRAAGYTTQSSGLYPGWDRFGRVIIHAWLDGGLTTGTDPLPNRPPIFDVAYTYDKNSNRLSAKDSRPGAKLLYRDWLHTYDSLDRVIQSDRGVWSSGSFTDDDGGQQWVLDMLGNWYKFRRDAGTVDHDGTFTDPGETEVRHHTETNEIEWRDTPPGDNPGELPFEYDASGNIVSAVRRGGATTDLYTHDAWNRLVKHEVDGVGDPVPLAEYEYNALHWRTVKRLPPDGAASTVEKRVYYYSAAWQMIQEDIDDDYGSSPGINRIAQEVYGTRYIDDAVHRRIDNNADGDYTDGGDKRLFHITDPQFSTVAIVGTGSDPALQETVRYMPYGEATHRYPGDINDDGQVNSTDSNMYLLVPGTGYPITHTSYNVLMDLNRDGTVNSTDSTILTTNWLNRTPPPAGCISDAAGPDNPMGYDGYVFNAESRDYTVRFRCYEPVLGRWMQRDPAGYVQGSNLLQYATGAPTGLLDPTGLCCGEDTQLWTFSGINNSCDYLALRLSLLLNGRTPDTSWYSALGTSDDYEGTGKRIGPQGDWSAQSRLDAEAEAYAATPGLGGQFCDQAAASSRPTKIRLVMLAPKTHTTPAINKCCCDVRITVVWSFADNVVNQDPLGIGESDIFWADWTMDVRTVDTKEATGIADPSQRRQFFDSTLSCPNHALRAFLVPLHTYAGYSGPNGERLYRASGATYDVRNDIKAAMDGNYDHVWVCHSQGCNTAMKAINAACNKSQTVTTGP